MPWFRSFLFNLFFWLWTIGLGILCLPFLILRIPFVIYTLPGFWIRGTLALLKFFCGIDYRVEGALPGRAVVYASKHQSAFETLAFWNILDRPAFILKRELLWIPIFGWYLAAVKPIAIDRRAGSSALVKVIRDTQANLQAGRSVVIFPEGTRTAYGETRPYQPGIAAIYHKLQAAVAPVALNSGKFWKRNSFTKTPGTVTIRLLPVIPPGMDKKQFLARLQEMIEKESASL